MPLRKVVFKGNKISLLLFLFHCFVTVLPTNAETVNFTLSVIEKCKIVL